MSCASLEHYLLLVVVVWGRGCKVEVVHKNVGDLLGLRCTPQ